LVERILGKDEVSSSNLDSSSSSEHPEAIKASGCFLFAPAGWGSGGKRTSVIFYPGYMDDNAVGLHKRCGPTAFFVIFAKKSGARLFNRHIAQAVGGGV
jgi:hypothetical protein